MPGPLEGMKVVEFAGIGPAPFCAMMLADYGADVLRIARPGTTVSHYDVTCRNRLTVPIDLRSSKYVESVLSVVSRADVLIEGFRPGVMERLGLGPDVCMETNRRLVYGRMTGWGQYGSLSHAAGHDINYIGIVGALHAVGLADEPPVPPLNLVGDYGGGAMLLCTGLLAALLEARRSGQGQVVDAAMTDGAALLCTNQFAGHAAGKINNKRGHNLLDGGAPFYRTYRCADGKFIAIGSIEPKFYKLLLERCAIDDPLFDDQMDQGRWPEMADRLASVFSRRTQEEWCALLEGTDACFSAVLDWDDAPCHPHNRSRGTFVEVAGVVQPAPAPRFSRTELPTPTAPRTATRHDLLRWGLPEELLEV